MLRTFLAMNFLIILRIFGDYLPVTLILKVVHKELSENIK